MSTVEFKFFDLRRDLEKLKGRIVTSVEIAEATGLSRNTIDALSKDPRGIRFDTLAVLIDYFNREGLKVEPGDFFKAVKDEGGSDPERQWL